MPKIKPIRPDLFKFLKKRNLTKKFHKQALLFKENPKHPSLNTEIIEPKELKIYSFRVDKKYRAIFIFIEGEVEIIDINNHYR